MAGRGVYRVPCSFEGTSRTKMAADGGGRRSGLFNNAKASYSQETREFIKVLMEESKVAMTHRRKINDAVDKGESLLSTSNSRRFPPSVGTDGPLRLINAGPSKRSLTAIHAMGAYEMEQYRPNPMRGNLSKEKERLQDIMYYGKNGLPTLPEYDEDYDEDDGDNKSLLTPPNSRMKSQPEDVNFDKIAKEIEKYIATMEELKETNNFSKFDEVRKEVEEKLQKIGGLDRLSDNDKQHIHEVVRAIQENEDSRKNTSRTPLDTRTRYYMNNSPSSTKNSSRVSTRASSVTPGFNTAKTRKGSVSSTPITSPLNKATPNTATKSGRLPLSSGDSAAVKETVKKSPAGVKEKKKGTDSAKKNQGAKTVNFVQDSSRKK